MTEDYKDIFGTWNVNTENDAEGRSTKQLGIYTGYVDDIALHLADKCYYKLCFKKVNTKEYYIKKKESVVVQFDIESETWNSKRFEHIKEAFSNRPVIIRESNMYASFVIESKDYKAELIEKALNKLTDEEKKVLGL